MTAEETLYTYHPIKHDLELRTDLWPTSTIVDAMKEYGQLCAEQARQEEREKHKYIVAAMFGLIEEDWMPKETKLGMKFHLQEAGYETEEHNQNKEQ